MKTTRYFLATRERPDRAGIQEAWILQAMHHPERALRQQDGRIRRWAKIEAAEGRYLRVVLPEDGETVHDAFFDRGFEP